MWTPPKNDIGYSSERLRRILNGGRLRFNPYLVSDARLLEIVNSTGWGNECDITEIVVLRFTRLQKTEDWRNFTGIFMQMGNSAEEVFINKSSFIYGVIANDSIKPERSVVGKKPVRNEKDIENLVGKTFFVSRVIRGSNKFGSGRVAYRMHRLTGKPEKDAIVIREAIVAAKIEMLERILAYPESPDYLSCSRGFFDFETPIRYAIEVIRNFPLAGISSDM